MLDLGLVFEVVGALWIALVDYGGMPLSDLPFRGFSGISVWIVFFVLVIPVTLGKVVLASLATALNGADRPADRKSILWATFAEPRTVGPVVCALSRLSRMAPLHLRFSRMYNHLEARNGGHLNFSPARMISRRTVTVNAVEHRG
jgi:hypothetical protein